MRLGGLQSVRPRDFIMKGDLESRCDVMSDADLFRTRQESYLRYLLVLGRLQSACNMRSIKAYAWQSGGQARIRPCTYPDLSLGLGTREQGKTRDERRHRYRSGL